MRQGSEHQRTDLKNHELKNLPKVQKEMVMIGHNRQCSYFYKSVLANNSRYLGGRLI